MLSARDAKLVKRYYLLPKAAWYSLVALFLTGALAILLVMIDNIGLGSKGFGDLQLIAMAALMIAEGATCIACGVAARRGLGSAHWQELEREAIGGNASIGTNPAVAGGIGVAAAGRLVDTLDNDDLVALSTGLEITGAAMATYGFFDTMRRGRHRRGSSGAASRHPGQRRPRRPEHGVGNHRRRHGDIRLLRHHAAYEPGRGRRCARSRDGTPRARPHAWKSPSPPWRHKASSTPCGV